MSSKSTFYFSFISLGIILLLVLVQTYFKMSPQANERFLKYNEIAGSEIIYQEIPFTLSFEQQNRLIAFINNSEPASAIDLSEHFPFTQITFYRFNQPPLQLIPRKIDPNSFCFELKAPHQNILLKSKEVQILSFFKTLYE